MVAALQERVVAEIDAGDDIGGAEGDLLGFGKEVGNVAVQDHAADGGKRREFLGDHFGCIEDVEGEFFDDGLVQDLDGKFRR